MKRAINFMVSIVLNVSQRCAGKPCFRYLLLRALAFVFLQIDVWLGRLLPEKP